MLSTNEYFTEVHTAHPADIDNDGDKDIVVAGVDSNGNSILLNYVNLEIRFVRQQIGKTHHTWFLFNTIFSLVPGKIIGAFRNAIKLLFLIIVHFCTLLLL